MTSITWTGPKCVQEAAAILGPQNRIQGRCGNYSFWSVISFDGLFKMKGILIRNEINELFVS